MISFKISILVLFISLNACSKSKINNPLELAKLACESLRKVDTAQIIPYATESLAETLKQENEAMNDDPELKEMAKKLFGKVVKCENLKPKFSKDGNSVTFNSKYKLIKVKGEWKVDRLSK